MLLLLRERGAEFAPWAQPRGGVGCSVRPCPQAVLPEGIVSVPEESPRTCLQSSLGLLEDERLTIREQREQNRA